MFEKRIILTIIVPTAHTKPNVEKGPLPETGGKIVLLVRVGDECIIGCHHGYIEVNEILEEGGFVIAWITSRDYQG